MFAVLVDAGLTERPRRGRVVNSAARSPLGAIEVVE